MQKVFIIGGLGHIGLCLAAVISDYYEVFLFDSNDKARYKFNIEKKAAFFEPGIDDLLQKNIKKIEIVTNLRDVKKCDYVVIAIGTYIDEYFNPVLDHIFSLFTKLSTILTNQTIIFRSTMYPGMTKKIEKLFTNNIKIAFCPERIQSGNMIKELKTLPQIISANTEEALQKASDFFTPLQIKQRLLRDTTAGELAKLMTNAYRYIEFAIANHFLEMSLDAGCDFYEVFDAIIDEYPRLKNLSKPGYTGGSCLRKDSLQLAAWYSGATFSLAHNASIINEGLPLFIFRQMRKKIENLSEKTIGLLGMAFKADCDDIRDSLSFRMKKILENEVKEVLCTDPYVVSKQFVKLDYLIKKSDIIILMTPHSQYKDITITKPVIDIWNFFGKGIGL